MEQHRDPGVFEVCTLLARACRAVRFYPPSHPVTIEGMSALFSALEATLAQRASLRLEVGETALGFEGATVYATENLQDNIAFYMYRDGIRSLVFYNGVQFDEVMGLVSCLARARELDKAESDLVTVLWEQDFSQIQYEVVDPLLEAEDADDDSMEDVREGVRTALTDASAQGFNATLAVDRDPLAALGAIEELDGSLLDQDDMARLETALESEPDMLQQFLVVLMEMLASNAGEAEMGGVANAVTGVLSSYLEWGEFAALASSVRMLREFFVSDPQQAALLEQILAPLTSEERLRKPIYSLDGPFRDKRGDVELMLLQLGSAVRPALLALLIDADGQTARKTLLNVLTAGDGVPLPVLVPHLDDPRWYVVRNVVILMGALTDPSVVDLLERTLSHPDERVRREAVRALAGTADPRAVRLVRQAIDDPAASVRIPAARAYAASGAPDARDRIMRHVTAKDFSARPEAEVEAFLEALGMVADDQTVPTLDELWGGRSFLRNRPQHVRLAALRALGHIGSPRAQESLRRAARAGDDQISRQAARCLAGADQRAVAL